MSKIDDGNTTDVRLRPDTAPIVGADEDLRAPIPIGDPCTTVGTQTDLPPSGPVDDTTIPPDFVEIFDWGNIAALCPAGLTMTAVTNIIMQLLVTHFSNPDNIINPNLKSLIYNPNPAMTKIVININTTYAPVQSTTLPALIIKRNEQDTQRIVMGDLSESKDDPALGLVPFTRKVRGTHTIMAITPFPGVTEELAQEVYEFLTCLSPILRTQQLFADFQVVAVSEVQIVEELGNRTMVGIQVLYEYEYSWKIQYNTAPLSKITATETTELG